MNKEEYKKQLEFELNLIQKNGFVRYFLIVYDLIEWAKKNGISTGPGRGSVTGSLVSYLLGITDIDPFIHKTNFSRFLNEGRKSLPDIDIDFADIDGDKVIGRLKELYGENNIAGVTTFIKMEDKGIVRDVARVFDVPLKEVNDFTSTIVEDIESALKTEEGIRFNAKYSEVIKHALKLKGQEKAYGRHAAAQIISSDDLTLGTRANLVERNGQKVINWSMEDCEYMGLLKLDVLRLSTLSVISKCLSLIKENHNKNIDLSKINIDDKAIFRELSNGNTTGVFQFSTWSMTKLSKDMGISNFKEMHHALAFVRPGPADSGMTEEYILRKNGKSWNKKHDVFEEITKDTLGIITYQEQVLEIFQQIAGLSSELADKIRKVIGKKRDAAEFEPYKVQFVEGCKNVGYFNEKEALDFWEELQSYARYGFSKNHAVAYALLSYQTAWLKHYFPTEFICASLTFGSDSQKENLIKEAQRLGLSIVPPKLGVSSTDKWVAKNGKLYVPFLEVKGIGPKSLDKIKEFKPDNGFFKTQKPITGKLRTILEDIGAFSDDIPKEIDKYFDLGIVFCPSSKYPNLFDLVKESYDIEDLLSGNIKNKYLVEEVKDKSPISSLISCKECGLRKGCLRPLHPNFGEYNVMILQESPNWKEDKFNKYFGDESGNKVLTPELEKYGFELSDFYISSVVKCKSNKPEKESIDKCSKKWLNTEIERLKPRIILAFGNAGLQVFEGIDSGIMTWNGKTKWNEEYGAWICYCVNPNLVLYKPLEFKKLFKQGISNFVEKLENIGGFE